VKRVSGDHHHRRPHGQHIVYGPLEGALDVRLPLVEAGGCLPVILAEPQMEIGEVGEFHAGKSTGNGKRGKEGAALFMNRGPARI
jgi:hypothetical protein